MGFIPGLACKEQGYDPAAAFTDGRPMPRLPKAAVAQDGIDMSTGKSRHQHGDTAHLQAAAPTTSNDVWRHAASRLTVSRLQGTITEMRILLLAA
jgi:hypothetical protein